jgi:hypothetical protein
MFSTQDFEKIGWHDNAIHGFRIQGENARAELVFDIDYIVEWLPPVDGAFIFKMAPSDLVFHEVSDLVISIDYAASTAAVEPMFLDEIHRERITYPNGNSSFAWELEINWPVAGFFRFHSRGFTQTQRKAPVATKAAYLSSSERKTALPYSTT